MNKDSLIRLVNEQMWTKTDADVPQFNAGDTILFQIVISVADMLWQKH